MSYDYFYNQEVEQFRHYQMPYLFFVDDKLRSLPINVKFLYSVLLDRAKSSYDNGFIDNEGKVYVHFSQAELTEILNCGRTKMSEYFKELENIGLIERRQMLGIGKSDRIYVKNFASKAGEYIPDKPENSRYSFYTDMSGLRFKHIKIPKMLFTDTNIKNISNVAKMAYSFLLDRTELSIEHGIKDQDGRVYVVFSQKELQGFLMCSMRTLKSALAELDIGEGKAGLIYRSKQYRGNNDRIYVLDFVTADNGSVNIRGAKSEHRNSLQNVESVETVEKTPDINSVNTRGAKSEHLDVQNLNTGSAKPEHQECKIRTPEVQNLNTYYNDTDVNDTDVNDTDVIGRHGSNEVSPQADRLTDDNRNNKRQDKAEREKTFYEILSEINSPLIDYDFNFRSEQDMCEMDEADRCTGDCKIPYTLQQSPKAFRTALQYLSAYSYRYTDQQNDRSFADRVITAICEAVSAGEIKIQHKSVAYDDIIDRLNYIIHVYSLADWIYYFKDRWDEIISDTNIHNSQSYFKVCAVSYLFEYESYIYDLESKAYNYNFYGR